MRPWACISVVYLAPSLLHNDFTVEKLCCPPSGVDLNICKLHPAHKFFNSKLADITHCDWKEMRQRKWQRQGGVRFLVKWSRILRRTGWDKSSWCVGSYSCASCESKPVEFHQGMLSRMWPHTNYWRFCSGNYLHVHCCISQQISCGNPKNQ